MFNAEKCCDFLLQYKLEKKETEHLDDACNMNRKEARCDQTCKPNNNLVLCCKIRNIFEGKEI